MMSDRVRVASPLLLGSPHRISPLPLLPHRLRSEHKHLWLLDHAPEPPLTDIIAACARRDERMGVLDHLGGRPLGHEVVLRGARTERELDLTVRYVRPVVLLAILRARHDVVIVQEVNLLTGFAVLSKIVRRRAVVALIEGDLTSRIGRTGSARWKMAYRRTVARAIDLFIANDPGARHYLLEGLGIDGARVLDGWWLAGHPEGLEPPVTRGERGMVFLTAGRLVPAKGVDLLLRGFAHAHRATAHRLRIAGAGPQEVALRAMADALGVAAQVDFLGILTREELAEEMRRSDVFVFPTLQDLIGRVAVEALSVGTPVIVSIHAGAARALVRDGINGLVVDPEDGTALHDALTRAVDEVFLATLTAGAVRSAPGLTPEAAAGTILNGVARARVLLAD